LAKITIPPHWPKVQPDAGPGNDLPLNTNFWQILRHIRSHSSFLPSP